MATLNEFWRDMFGEDISPFEYNLVVRGAQVMTPEEPLFALFAVMTRMLHGTLGDAERAILRFAPEIAATMRSMTSSAGEVNEQLRVTVAKVDELDRVLLSLGASLGSPIGSGSPCPWHREWAGPILTGVSVSLICLGFLAARILGA